MVSSTQAPSNAVVSTSYQPGNSGDNTTIAKVENSNSPTTINSSEASTSPITTMNKYFNWGKEGNKVLDSKLEHMNEYELVQAAAAGQVKEVTFIDETDNFSDYYKSYYLLKIKLNNGKKVKLTLGNASQEKIDYLKSFLQESNTQFKVVNSNFWLQFVEIIGVFIATALVTTGLGVGVAKLLESSFFKK